MSPLNKDRTGPFAFRTLIGCGLALSLGVFCASMLGGCASSQKTGEAPAEQGPPPEGYATWEDYWEAQDKDYQDFDNDTRQHRMTQPDVPGARR